MASFSGRHSVVDSGPFCQLTSVSMKISAVAAGVVALLGSLVVRDAGVFHSHFLPCGNAVDVGSL